MSSIDDVINEAKAEEACKDCKDYGDYGVSFEDFINGVEPEMSGSITIPIKEYLNLRQMKVDFIRLLSSAMDLMDISSDGPKLWMPGTFKFPQTIAILFPELAKEKLEELRKAEEGKK